MMINPSIDQLTKGGQFNRYALVIATAKCAKVVTDDYVAQRERAEKMIAEKKTDKTIASLIDPALANEKAVKNAINRMSNGEYEIVDAPEIEQDEEILED